MNRPTSEELCALGLPAHATLEVRAAATAPERSIARGLDGSRAELDSALRFLSKIASIERPEGTLGIARSDVVAGVYVLERDGLEVVASTSSTSVEEDPVFVDPADPSRLVVDARAGRVVARVRVARRESVLAFEERDFGWFPLTTADVPPERAIEMVRAAAPTPLDALRLPPLAELLDDPSDCPAWLAEPFARTPSPVGLDAVDAVATLGRVWSPTNKRDAWARLLGGEEPWSRGASWFGRLSDEVARAALVSAVEEAISLGAALDSVLELGGGDRRRAREVARSWLERRDRLASISELTFAHARIRSGPRQRLDAELERIDRDARAHASAWRAMGRVGSPRLSAVASFEPNAWWAELGSESELRSEGEPEDVDPA